MIRHIVSAVFALTGLATIWAVEAPAYGAEPKSQKSSIQQADKSQEECIARRQREGLNTDSLHIAASTRTIRSSRGGRKEAASVGGLSHYYGQDRRQSSQATDRPARYINRTDHRIAPVLAGSITPGRTRTKRQGSLRRRR